MMDDSKVRHQLARVLYTVRIAAYLFPLFMFGYVGVKVFAPFGTTTMTYDFKHEATAIGPLEPDGRVQGRVHDLVSGEYYQRMVVDPVYFNVLLPRNFLTAKVELTYSNPSFPIIELGGRVEKDVFHFDLKPVENRFIDNLSAPMWKVERRGDIVFAQKPLEYRGKSIEEIDAVADPTYPYGSMDDFLARYEGKDGRLVRYNYDFHHLNPIAGYVPSQEDLEVTVPLRGGHTLWVYAEEGELLNARFIVEDANLKYGTDYFTIKLQRLGRIIAESALPDDGDDTISGVSSGEREIDIAAQAPETGYYALRIDATQDMFIKKIVARQHRLLIGKQAVLAGNVAYRRAIPDLATTPTSLYFYGTGLEVALSDEIDEQHIEQESRTITLTEDERRQSISYGEARVRPLRVEENGVVLATDGYLGFTPDAFSHLPSDVDVTADAMSFTTNMDDYGYVLARSMPVVYEDVVKGWKKTSAEFELGRLARVDDRTVQFLISANGLDQLHNEIVIKEIKVTLRADPLTPKKIFQKVWQKLK